ncbi:MAG: energy transducer TonB [Gammaproteobacteria bacterium]|nr:energy transducer TonB [Gammaproteobacteria bacterium]MYD81676.1 energy transducer TonB [Gammaproteobacteria bacterium]
MKSYSRWLAALLVASSLHALMVVSWLGFASLDGATHGNQGVHDGVSIILDIDPSPTSDVMDETEKEVAQLDPTPTVFEQVQPSDFKLEQIPTEIPLSDLQPVFELPNPPSIPTLEVPLIVLKDDQFLQSHRPSAQSGAGPGSSNQVGSTKRLSDSHLARVAAHLNRFKKYPNASRRAKEEGKAGVTFRVFADGRVDSIQLTKSTGYAELDEEALSMVKRASPYPKFPNSLNRRGVTELEVRSSINFSIKD